MSAVPNEAVLRPHRFNGVGGVALAADIGGDLARDPVVILLHGGGQTRQSWGTAARALIEAGYAAIVLDARGHGESDWAGPDESRGGYAMEAFAGDLAGVIDTLPDTPGRPRPALVGASLGGITSLIALGESDRPLASALVLVDIAPRMNIEGANRIGAFMQSHREGFATIEEAADAVAAYLPHRKRPSDVSGLSRNLRQGVDGRLRWHWDPSFVRPRHHDMEAFQRRLEDAARRVTAPTLLVRGGRSEVVTDDAVAHFRDLMPQAELVTVAGASHMVAGDDNDAFNSAILDFLGRAVR